MGFDVEVRGNRYSVPAELAGQTVRARIGEQLVAQHALWAETLALERRPLAVDKEVAAWN